MKIYNYIQESLDRSKLPFRDTVYVFVLYNKNKIFARKLSRPKNNGFWLMLPGGGIDPGETIEEAAKRETLEEAGIIIDNMKKISEMSALWPADFQKGKRYNKYKGMRINLVVAKLIKITKPTSKEGDGWPIDMNKRTMDIKEAIEVIKNDRVDADIWKKYNKISIDIINKLK